MYMHMEIQRLGSRDMDMYIHIVRFVSHTVLIVSDGLVSGVQFSLNQLCADLSQVCVRVPFFGIFSQLNVNLLNVFIMGLFQMDSLLVADL